MHESEARILDSLKTSFIKFIFDLSSDNLTLLKWFINLTEEHSYGTVSVLKIANSTARRASEPLYYGWRSIVVILIHDVFVVFQNDPSFSLKTRFE